MNYDQKPDRGDGLASLMIGQVLLSTLLKCTCSAVETR
jgi:hypothetical protein